jgi:hypothetical protein
VTGCAPRQRRLHLGRGEQRALDLHEVHVGGIADAGVGHRGAHGRGRGVTCAMRPISSGSEVARVRDAHHQPLVPAWPVRHPRRVNTVKCGDSTPSVPPDITSATRWATSAGLQPRCGARKWHQLVAAKSRVWSLTQPLPSVLPITATMSAGTSAPASISACTPRQVARAAAGHAEHVDAAARVRIAARSSAGSALGRTPGGGVTMALL